MPNVPSINQAYAMVVLSESRKMITGNNYEGSSSIDLTTLFIAHSSQTPKKNYNLQCNYCHLKGHTKSQCYKLIKCDFYNKSRHVRETCYKIMGYPSDFKGKY